MAYFVVNDGSRNLQASII
ncbi:hypothetical protein F383_37277 [Gossypium arboreum]|uniref:Uncharacterized protein n=1 Tax=Gossypium arboreum TaxID=29729 RepID=A0A0B0NH68_GOSAR|nr:hypothetical protein F383_37277 [Gossypium arboreum]